MSARDPTHDPAIVGHAEARQRDAADPAASVWVSANAGSGKTRVLVDRVTRLLLAGARPHQVLCLTYTRAAAAEMLRRLSARLGEWATAPDAAALGSSLARLLGREPTGPERETARRLFAATLDAPGGLRVQTIHAFCESILKRFPVEAGLDPGFSVAEERAMAELIRLARERTLDQAASDATLGTALEAVVARTDEGNLVKLLAQLVSDRQGLRRVLAAHGGDVERAIAATRQALGVVAGETPQQIAARFLAGLDLEALREAGRALARGSADDIKKLDWLGACLDAKDPAAEVDCLLRAVLTAELQPYKSVATKKVVGSSPAAIATLEALRDGAVAFVAQRNAAYVAEGTAALLRVGARLLALYDSAKREAGLLDYDDLIRLTARLLGDEDEAWVRFKLDGGIEHVLVDEAQDTSPEQWAVLAALIEDFFAGEGAGGDRARTLFAVGDPKQSIFGFQGAAPEEFARVREVVRERAAGAGRAFRPVELDASFRSAPEVLEAVDAAFAGGAEPTRHRAVRARAPGLVELWPLVAPSPAAPVPPWDAPLDYEGEDSPPARLARIIARTIRGWIDGRELLAARGRAVHAGDVLILVQRRNAFFEAMVRALKEGGIAVAGADRLTLTAHIAVEDLIALGRFALLPDDEYTLACVLKSPFGGLDDDDLHALCRGRRFRLWTELRRRADERPGWRRAADLLIAALARADRTPAFEFYAWALSAVGGRRALLGRLGAEAADPVDEFLALALADEVEHPPSLEGFLDRLERGETVVKRDMEEAHGQVRVMTVHAAKGLESPIVFLPDSVRVPDARLDGALLWRAPEDGPPLVFWPGKKARDEACCAAARQAAERRREDEYARLLYVAMTRAEDRLYVCGWRGERAETPKCWHTRIAAALAAAGAGTAATPTGEGLRLDSGKPPPSAPTHALAPVPLPPPPAWAAQPVPPEPPTPRPLAPSGALPGAEPPALRPLLPESLSRYRRGQLVHRLLERLPDVAPEGRRAAAERFLADPRHGLDAPSRAALAAEVLAVLDAPGLAALFAPDSLAEVPVVGTVTGRPIAGQVDRLAVTPGEVLVVDYKSNRQPPREVGDVAPVYVAQMALYRALLQQVWPGRRVRCALLWTESARLMELPEAALESARVNALDR